MDQSDPDNVKDAVDMLEVYDFTMWYSSIESWYIRCKFNEKLEFLKQIFDALKNKESMIVWCNILNNNLCDKVFAYFQEVINPEIHYDTVIYNTNNTSDEKTLVIAMIDATDKFKQYEEEVQQAMFITLLRLGGNVLIKTMLNYVKSNNGIAITKKSIQKASTTETVNLENIFDQTVINKRIEFDKIMDKYATELGKKQKDNDAKNKDGKYNTDGKNKKGRKSSESSPSKKNKQKSAVCLDYVQQLPIQIVKQIFGYLDKKTLKTIKDVNEYWSWVVGNLEEDVKTRKIIDKALIGMRKDLKQTPIKKELITSKVHSRMQNNKYPGTLGKQLSKLINLPHESTYKHDIFSVACKNMNHYILSTPINPFPRNLPKREQKYNLYKHLPCNYYNTIMKDNYEEWFSARNYNVLVKHGEKHGIQIKQVGTKIE